MYTDILFVVAAAVISVIHFVVTIFLIAFINKDCKIKFKFLFVIFYIMLTLLCLHIDDVLVDKGITYFKLITKGIDNGVALEPDSYISTPLLELGDTIYFFVYIILMLFVLYFSLL